MIPVTLTRFGEKQKVISISGRDSVRNHLANLGCVPGAEVSVVSSMGGNVILALKDTRLALDAALAGKIMV